MKYVSQKQKTREFIAEQILPIIKNRDLDYEKTINLIISRTGASRNIVEELINSFNEIKQVRILTIQDEDIISYLKDEKLKQQTIEEELKELTI